MVVDQGGSISVREGDVRVEQGKIRGNDNIRGRASINGGETSVRIDKSWGEEPVVVNITLKYNTQYWIEDLSAEGFTLRLQDAPESDSEVQWMAIW